MFNETEKQELLSLAEKRARTYLYPINGPWTVSVKWRESKYKITKRGCEYIIEDEIQKPSQDEDSGFFRKTVIILGILLLSIVVGVGVFFHVQDVQEEMSREKAARQTVYSFVKETCSLMEENDIITATIVLGRYIQTFEEAGVESEISSGLIMNECPERVIQVIESIQE